MKALAVSVVAVFAVLVQANAAEFRSEWPNTFDRVWLGEAYWANPMEDWRVEDGRAVCLGGADRNVALLTREVIAAATALSSPTPMSEPSPWNAGVMTST